MGKKTDIDLSDYQVFYKSMPAPCPYLDNLSEQKLFTQLAPTQKEKDIRKTLSHLTRAGFRRSYDIVYKPVCAACNACIPARINVNEFDMNKYSVKRIVNKNAPLKTTFGEKYIDYEDAFLLFKDYQKKRHQLSEMADMDFKDFYMMFDIHNEYTDVMAAYDEKDNLIASLLYDSVDDGYSAIYSFYRPDMPKASLGKYVIYEMIKKARAENKPYIYLGYWIKESPKMAYKGDFDALEILKDGQWVKA